MASPRCAVEGCTKSRAATRLMCRVHWRATPYDLRSPVNYAYREHGAKSREYIEAARAALAFHDRRPEPVSVSASDTTPWWHD